MPGSIEGTDKGYVATWAALLAVEGWNRKGGAEIRRVGFPAMGTGFGGVRFEEAARQMAAAWRPYLEPPHRLDWEEVTRRERAIWYEGERRVAR